MQDRQRIWGFFAHANIIAGMMFVVFFVIDRFNPAMEFLTSSLSKWLILFLAISTITNGLFAAIFLFQRQKRRDEKRSSAQAKPLYPQEYMTQQRLAQPYYHSNANSSQQRQPNGSVPQQGYQANQQRPMNGQSYGQPKYSGEQPRAGYGREDSYRG